MLLICHLDVKKMLINKAYLHAPINGLRIFTSEWSRFLTPCGLFIRTHHPDTLLPAMAVTAH